MMGRACRHEKHRKQTWGIQNHLWYWELTCGIFIRQWRQHLQTISPVISYPWVLLESRRRLSSYGNMLLHVHGFIQGTSLINGGSPKSLVQCISTCWCWYQPSQYKCGFMCVSCSALDQTMYYKQMPPVSRFIWLWWVQQLFSLTMCRFWSFLAEMVKCRWDFHQRALILPHLPSKMNMLLMHSSCHTWLKHGGSHV